MQECVEVSAASSPRVSVIVPAGAAAELLPACLRSLARHGPAAIPFETIVVLNGAGQHGAGWLDTSLAGVRVLRPGVNLGLAGAGNAGRELARGEYLVLLHDDAEVEPGWLEALVEAADSHPEAGAVGGKVLHPDGSLQNAGMVLWREGITSPPWAGEPPPTPAAFDRRRAVDYCGTSSLLVRAASWDAVGGLDERFFPAYYVDVDLCMALRRLGEVVLYEPRSRIRHHRGGSGNRRFREFVTRRNRQLFLSKWGAALTEYEAAALQSPAAVDRALAHAEQLAARLSSGRGVAVATAVATRGSVTVGPASAQERRERRHLELDLELRRAYAEHLGDLLEEAAERPLADWRREAKAREAAESALRRAESELGELRARAATLAAIEAGRWWRLYVRLLPILRRLPRTWRRRRLRGAPETR